MFELADGLTLDELMGMPRDQAAKAARAISARGLGHCLALAGSCSRADCSADGACARPRLRDLANERIAACTAMLKSGRLRGRPGRRRLCTARPRLSSIAATFRTPSPTSTRQSRSRPISPPPTRTAAMPGTRAAITARRIADYDTAIKLDPNAPSPYVNRATVRRDLGYTEGAMEDYQKAIEPRRQPRQPL